MLCCGSLYYSDDILWCGGGSSCKWHQRNHQWKGNFPEVRLNSACILHSSMNFILCTCRAEMALLSTNIGKFNVSAVDQYVGLLANQTHLHLHTHEEGKKDNLVEWMFPVCLVFFFVIASHKKKGEIKSVRSCVDYTVVTFLKCPQISTIGENHMYYAWPNPFFFVLCVCDQVWLARTVRTKSINVFLF